MPRLSVLAPLALPLALAACFGSGGNGGSGVPLFTSFDAIEAGSVVDVPGESAVNYNGVVGGGEINAESAPETGSSTARLTFDENVELSAVRLANSFSVRGDSATEFTDPPVAAGTDDELLLATRLDGVDPSDRVWIYQGPNGNQPFSYMTFGIWELGIGGDTDLGGAAWGSSAEAATVTARAGAVTYTGRLLGTQIQAGANPTGTYRSTEADATLTADFDANTIALASSNTQLLGQPGNIGLNIETVIPAEIAGSSFGTNGVIRIDGAEGVTAGTFGGQFFGPAAEEVGGWFDVDNTTNNDRYFGAFGAAEVVP